MHSSAEFMPTAEMALLWNPEGNANVNIKTYSAVNLRQSNYGCSASIFFSLLVFQAQQISEPSQVTQWEAW